MNKRNQKILMGGGAVCAAATVLTLFLVDFGGNDVEGDAKFQKHISTMNLQFNSKEEYDMRKTIFKIKDAQIESHNEKYRQGKSKYYKKHNQFSTMTVEEMNQFKSGTSFYSQHKPKSEMTSDELASAENLRSSWHGEMMATASPSEINWVTAGAVNPIKNQAQCGSCYSFGSTAVVESSVFNNGWDLPNLSEQ